MTLHELGDLLKPICGKYRKLVDIETESTFFVLYSEICENIYVKDQRC